MPVQQQGQVGELGSFVGWGKRSAPQRSPIRACGGFKNVGVRCAYPNLRLLFLASYFGAHVLPYDSNVGVKGAPVRCRLH